MSKISENSRVSLQEALMRHNVIGFRLIRNEPWKEHARPLATARVLLPRAAHNSTRAVARGP